MKLVFLILLTALSLAGCSNQAMYNSIQASQEEECRQMPPGRQQECFARLGTTYQEYERQRQELIEGEE